MTALENPITIGYYDVILISSIAAGDRFVYDFFTLMPFAGTTARAAACVER